MTAESTPKRTKAKSSPGMPEIVSLKKTATPPTPAPEPTPTPPTVAPQTPDLTPGIRFHPIPPVSERMQYRAIGLVKGIYKPDPGQFNRGLLVTQDGQEIEAVLLGQVMNVIKKYLDPDKEHLWVVYPRTRDLARERKKEDFKQDGQDGKSKPQPPQSSDVILHLQIVGVWEPEILQQDTPLASAAADDPVESDDGYFSVRGEVIFNSQDKKFVMVKIQQQPKKKTDKGKAFKVRLEGVVEMKSPGYFWDLHAQRQGGRLVITAANPVGVLPPRKVPKTARPGKPPFRKPASERSDRPNPSGLDRRPAAARPIRRSPSKPSS